MSYCLNNWKVVFSSLFEVEMWLFERLHIELYFPGCTALDDVPNSWQTLKPPPEPSVEASVYPLVGSPHGRRIQALSDLAELLDPVHGRTRRFFLNQILPRLFFFFLPTPWPGDSCCQLTSYDRSLRRWTAAYVSFELSGLTPPHPPPHPPVLPSEPNAEEWIVCLSEVGGWSRVMNSRKGAAAAAAWRWPHCISANSSRTWLISPSPVYRGYGLSAQPPTTLRSKKYAL